MQTPYTAVTRVHTRSIGIAGAGLLGRLIAWQLVRAGNPVTLFNDTPQGSDTSAAYTAAGMLAPVSEAAASHRSIYPAGLRGIDTWKLWCQQLNCETAFHQAGSLILAHPQDLAELNQFAKDCQTIGTDAQLHSHSLDSDKLRVLEPDLSVHFSKGLLLEQEAHLDNRLILHALDNVLYSSDLVTFINEPVNTQPHLITSMVSQNQWEFNCVIDCRGAGARQQLAQLRGVRGETLHIHAPEVRFSRPVRLMHPRYQLYIVPKPEHRFVIGATQIESEDLSPISIQSNLELASALYSVSPAFSEARILEAGVNLRPAYLNNLPALQRQAGLIQANGLYRHGYLLAPWVVEHALATLKNNTNIELRFDDHPEFPDTPELTVSPGPIQKPEADKQIANQSQH